MKKLVIVMALVFGGFLMSNAQTANTEEKTEATPVVVDDSENAEAAAEAGEEAEASAEKSHAQKKGKASCSSAKAKRSCSSKKSCCSKSKAAAVKED